MVVGWYACVGGHVFYKHCAAVVVEGCAFFEVVATRIPAAFGGHGWAG